MSAINNNGSAFPLTGKDSSEILEIGMTLRDWFAGQALPAVYKEACRDFDQKGYPEHWRYGVAQDAYVLADAMIALRANSLERSA